MQFKSKLKVVESNKTMFYGFGIAKSGKIKFLFIYETPFEGWEPLIETLKSRLDFKYNVWLISGFLTVLKSKPK
jgi:folate-dependent phosphoribosylglycinamide formyltransferase PurN